MTKRQPVKNYLLPKENVMVQRLGCVCCQCTKKNELGLNIPDNCAYFTVLNQTNLIRSCLFAGLDDAEGE